VKQFDHHGSMETQVKKRSKSAEYAEISSGRTTEFGRNLRPKRQKTKVDFVYTDDPSSPSTSQSDNLSVYSDQEDELESDYLISPDKEYVGFSRNLLNS
jgi:hypothetical protein